MSDVTSIDRPRCSRCGQVKDDIELNAYDPLARVGQRYKDAYCKRVAECQSQEAIATMDSAVAALNETERK